MQAARDEVEAATATLVAGAQEIARSRARRPPVRHVPGAPGVAATRRRHRGHGVLTTGAGGFTALATAVADVRASHAAEVARTQEYPVRAEIEAFARSISNGVSLDFTWAYEVAGVTSDAWYAGTAEFGVTAPSPGASSR